MRIIKIALITLFICIGVPVFVFIVFRLLPGPTIASVSFVRYVVSPQYKELQQNDGGSAGWQCSKPIKTRKYFGRIGMAGYFGVEYVPVDDKEFKKYFQSTWIE